MKKRIVGICIAAGFLLLVSCGIKNSVKPIGPTGDGNTPTPIVVPTCTPTVGAPSDPVLKPTATATPTTEPTAEEPSPTAEPTKPVETTAPQESLIPSPEPTLLPSVTPTPEPTMVLQETLMPTPEPTTASKETPPPVLSATPFPEPTAGSSPTPTTALQETLTPSPAPSPVPTAAPTPEIAPETLVTNGWQKSIAIDEAYTIIFPETFHGSVMTRTDNELTIDYYSDKEPEIAFTVCYKMQKTVKEVALDIVAVNGMIIDEVPEEKRVYYLWKQDGIVYRGVLIERPYSRALLGNSFGEEEWITGVMQVIFTYPTELSEQYETDEYKYYVIENREE